jgi:hypothetical protein
MEPARTKIILGDFRVVKVELDGITVNLGKQVHITIHVGDFPHTTKPGDMIPLFTELTYAPTIATPIE